MISLPGEDRAAPSADGVPIYVRVRGEGPPAVVLIHCWLGDSGLFRDAQRALSHGRRVVALDLAGHGQSGTRRKEWSIAAFGEDVVAVVDLLRLEPVVLVGHSMGGLVMLEAARRLHGRVAGLVAIDTLKDADWQPPPGALEEFLRPFRADFTTAARAYVRSLFAPETDPVVAARAAERMAAVPETVGLPSLVAAMTYDLARGLRGVADLEIREIASPRFPTNLAANRRHAPRFETRTLPGVGHYPMIEAPQPFLALLESALRFDAPWA